MSSLLADTDPSFRPVASTSTAIRIVRPLLILFIMLAHIYALDSNRVLVNALPLDFDNWLTVYLESVLAKTGVPLLSLISGYLAVLSLRRYGYFRLLLRKARRLVWPMAWANLLFIVLISYPGQAESPGYRVDLAVYPFDLFGWLQATFGLYRLPANQPLFFLKDLFTCFLLLPILVLVARTRYLNLAVIPWMAWKCIYLKSVFIFPVYPLWFFRFDIVFAFYLGILLFQYSKDLRIENRAVNAVLVALFPLIGALAAACYVVLARAEYRSLFLWLDFAVKVASVGGCIPIMHYLAGRQGPVSRFLAWLSPYSYSMFLLHALCFDFYHRAYIAGFGQPAFFRVSGVAYLLGMFVVTVAVVVPLRMGWRRLLRGLRVPA